MQVDDRIIVGTPKSHEQRPVRFSASLSPALARAAADKCEGDLLFPGLAGSALRRVDGPGERWFWIAAQEAGVPALTLDDLGAPPRGSRSGRASVEAVQRMLGHASAAMTLDVDADLFHDDLDAVAIRPDEDPARTSVGGRG